MKKNVIVSLADSNYFPLLNELIDSIKRFKDSSKVAICILDAGLSDDQKTELSSKVRISFIGYKTETIELDSFEEKNTSNTQDRSAC